LYLPRCGSVAALPALANCNGHRGSAGNDPGYTINYVRHTTSGAAGSSLGTTIKYLRRTTSAATGNGLGTTINFL
jgi:gentisate 1,2-dioxygenase